ncbi:MAG: sugar ABC transporter substrate-binding protein [Rhodothermales bacterium]
MRITTPTVRSAGVLLALLLLLSSCQPSAAPDTPRVALIMKSLANEFFVTMADGARAHQAAHPDQYELIVNGIKNESDLSQQVAMVENMVSIGVDAIVIAPADSRALVPVLKRAADAGITVINIDNRLDEAVLADAGVSIPFVGPDNRKGAEQVGAFLAQRLQRGDQVAIVGGIPTAFNAQQREQGFRDAMSAAGVEIVSVQSGSWEQAPANTVASALLGEYPDLKALLCSNDNMALGAAVAVKQAGAEDRVHLVGFDNIEAVRQLIAEGRVLATADQHGDQLAVFGIEAALRSLAGEPVTGVQETPVDLITAETLK